MTITVKKFVLAVMLSVTAVTSAACMPIVCSPDILSTADTSPGG